MSTVLRPLNDHILIAVLDRKALARLAAERATTSRDVEADAPRIELVGSAGAEEYGLVLAVGKGRVHPTTGRLQEPQMRPGDVVLFPANAARLQTSYVAKDVVGGLALSDVVRNLRVVSLCEDSCDAIVELS